MDPGEIERTGLLEGVASEQRSEALAAFKAYEVGPGEVLLEEGESDRSMLVVVDGELEVSLGGVPLARLGRGDTAGEMTLFGSFDRRSATVTSRTAARLLVLDEEALRYLRLAENPVARTLEKRAIRAIANRLRETDQRIAGRASGEPYKPGNPRSLLGKIGKVLGVGAETPRGPAPQLVDVLRATHGFAGREEEVIRGVAARLQLVPFAAGDTIVEEGGVAEDAYIVAEGRVGVYCNVGTDRFERVATLGPGHVFGVVALTDARVRSATCRALEPCYLVRIAGGVFRELEAELTPEGRAFRRGLIDALSVQLRLANEHLLTLAGRVHMA